MSLNKFEGVTTYAASKKDLLGTTSHTKGTFTGGFGGPLFFNGDEGSAFFKAVKSSVLRLGFGAVGIVALGFFSR